MRALMFALPLMLIAAPAAAQQRPVPTIPPELTDPALGQKMGRMAGALSRALMDVRVGEIQAAVEGREPTAADRRRTVRDMAGGRAIDRDIERQVAAAAPAMQRGMQAMASALPTMMAAMDQVAQEFERATANLPQPGYPNR